MIEIKIKKNNWLHGEQSQHSENPMRNLVAVDWPILWIAKIHNT